MKPEQIQKDKSDARAIPTVFLNTQSKGTQMFLAILACVALPLIIYSNSLHAPFIFDDYGYIVNNPGIVGMSEQKSTTLYGKEYIIQKRIKSFRPLTFLTFSLNYHLGKLDPFGYHLFNVIIHILNTILVFLVARKIIIYTRQFPDHFEVNTKSDNSPHNCKKEKEACGANSVSDGESILLALMIGLLFSTHPINTEVVSYVSNRSDSLITLFYILTLISFLYAMEKGRRLFYIFSLICFSLSLLCKEIAVTLPVVILLSDYIFLCNFQKEKVLQKKFYYVPYIVVLFIYLVSRYSYLGYMGDYSEVTSQRWTPYTYFITQVFVVLSYLKMLFMPIRQCVDHFVQPMKSIFEPKIILSLAVWAGLFAMAYKICRNCFGIMKLLLFSFIWFFVTLSPTSSFFPVNDAMVERRLYLSGFGFSLGMMAFYLWVLKIDIRERIKIGEIRWKILLAVCGVHILLLSMLTWKRNQIYLNPILLWQEAIGMYQNNARAYENLGGLYRDRNEYAYALKFYQKATELDPDNPESLNNLGLIYSKQKDYTKALALFQKAMEINPHYAETYNSMGNLYFEQGSYTKALESYQKAIEIKPYYTEAYNNIAAVCYKNKDYNNSSRFYQEAIALGPDNPETLNNLGLVYSKQKDYAKALAAFQKVIEVNPRFAAAYNNMGNIYFEQKNHTKAIEVYQKAIEINPRYAEPHDGLGILYYELGDYEKALQEFKMALELFPDSRFIKPKVELLEKLSRRERR